MKALEVGRREVMSDDVLGAVFAIVRTAHRRERLTAHNYTLQSLVFRLVESGGYPLLSKHFVFSDAGPEPHSPVLSEAISSLQLAGLIGRENPEYERVTLTKTAEDYFDLGTGPRLDADEIAELERAAAVFAKEL